MRFQSPAPETLETSQLSLYQRIAETRTTQPNAPLPGPFGPWLLIPEIGQHLCELGNALRFQSHFSRAVMEIGILVTARWWRSNFEWYAHAPMAREAGVTDTQIEQIKQGERPIFPEAPQQIAFDAANELGKNTYSVRDCLQTITDRIRGEGLDQLCRAHRLLPQCLSDAKCL